MIEYLKTDNPMDPYWNQFGVDEAYWNVDPETEYIAFSIAQNINGEWGPLASKSFKTPAAPAAASGAKKEAGKPARIMKSKTNGKTAIPMIPLKKATKTAPALIAR